MSDDVLLGARKLCYLRCEPFDPGVDCSLLIGVDILVVLLRILVLSLVILLILLIIHYALTLCEVIWRGSSAASAITTQIHLTVQEPRHVWLLHLFFLYLAEDGAWSAAWNGTHCISELLGSINA
jgi:hypothetical protein